MAPYRGDCVAAERAEVAIPLLVNARCCIAQSEEQEEKRRRDPRNPPIKDDKLNSAPEQVGGL